MASGKHDGIGCEPCNSFWNESGKDKTRTPRKLRRFATFELGKFKTLKKDKFDRHARSHHHKQCVKLWVASKSGSAVSKTVANNQIGTPEEGDWGTLLEHVHRHSAVGKHGLAKVDRADKCKQM